MNHMKDIIFRILAMGICLLQMAGCSDLPKDYDRDTSYALPRTEDTYLGRIFNEEIVKHPGLAGVFLLSDGLDAFVARAILAGKAERSIDVQYYMFHQDTVGQLLVNELLKSADRGVRVRLLIDDIYGEEADDVWTALDAHQNMEVRMFNPFVRNYSKNLQWITRLKDVNYRMHSKTFTVDNQATVVGGRNIGDEYFNADPGLAFADLDLLAIGPVVPDVSKEFDEYWNSEYAYPASVLAGAASPDQINELRVKMDHLSQQEKAAKYIEALKSSELAKALRNDSADFKWAQAKVIRDSSEKKARGENWKSELLISQLWPYIERLTDELIIVSPYFVPGKKGADALCKLSEKGVTVRILTNSLASNDVSAVHAGYSRYRKQLLKAGVMLYEMDEEIKNKAKKKFTWLPGLSKSSLHAKTMVLDKKGMFVGSFNFDQRSLHINNEIGILFSNPEIAEKFSDAFDENIEKVAFRLALSTGDSDRESIRWHGQKDGKEIIFEAEPYIGFWKKLTVGFIKLLPVESQL